MDVQELNAKLNDFFKTTLPSFFKTTLPDFFKNFPNMTQIYGTYKNIIFLKNELKEL